MPNSYIEYSASGTGANQLGQQVFSFSSLDYLNISDIKVKGWNSSVWQDLALLSSYGDSTPTDGYNAADKTLKLAGVPSYNKIRLYRSTSKNALVDFVDGARLTESDLDTAYKQGLFVAQEVSEDAAAIGTTSTTNISHTGTTSVETLIASGTVVIPSGTAATHFYREGTWTATARSGNTGTGTYTKIGNLVWFSVTISSIASTGTSNEMNITGLPYTSANNSIDSAVSIGMEYKIDAPASTTTLRAKVGANSTSVFFYWSKNDLAYAISTCADFDASDAMINISGSYQIA
tara:strand:+ start:2738 stop:3610 length:873 start_codon:yes stop_codon:yes gene_type:complete